MPIPGLAKKGCRLGWNFLRCLWHSFRWKQGYAGIDNHPARTTRNASTRKASPGDRSIFFLADQPNWAFGNIVQHYSGSLQPVWRTAIGYRRDGALVDPRQFTLAFMLGGVPSNYDKSFRGRFIRGIYSHKWERTFSPRWELYRLLTGAAACVVPSRTLLERIRPILPPTFQVPSAVDPEQFFWIRDRTGPELVVGWTGNPASTWKRLEQIVKPACSAAGVQLRLATNLSRDQLNHFYNDVDVLLIASEPLEGDPNVLYEAGACGRTVIATRVGTVPELVVHGENGFIEQGTIEAFAERLKWCKAHVPEIRLKGKAHRERVLRGWTWDASCRKFADVVERVYSYLVA
jgi:hypothetical protein